MRAPAAVSPGSARVLQIPAFPALTRVLRRAPGRLERALIYLAVSLLFVVSPDLLEEVGYHYTSDMGSPLTRFHPATYVLSVVILIGACRSGNPLRFIDAIVAWPLAAVALVLFSFVIVWAVVIAKVPFTPLVETFVVPTLFLIVLAEQDERVKRRLSICVHVFLTLNALIALWEHSRELHLIGQGFYDDVQFRSSALLGHPLNNAAVTGLYVVALAVGGGRDLNRWLRPPLVTLQLLALSAFGGRTALLTALAALLITAVLRVPRHFRVRRIDKLVLICAMAAIPLAILSLAALYANGFFESLLDRFLDDSGSARAREVLPALIAHLKMSDLWFGPDQLYVRQLTILEGTEYGIESFWFASLLIYGILGVIPLWLGSAALSIQMILASRLGALLVMAQFWIVASSANSIATKGLTLVFLEVILMCLLRPLRSSQAGAAGAV